MPVIVGEDTYFSAEDARRVSDEQRRSIDNAELDKVYKHIDEARWKGENKVTIYDFNLRGSTKKFLEDKGFEVKHWRGSQWDPCNNTIISW